MLTRQSQVGEFYVMSPPQVPPVVKDGDKEVQRHTCDMMIYDEESDKHVRVTWADALEATLATEMSKRNPQPKVATGYGNGEDLSTWYNKASAWRATTTARTPTTTRPSSTRTCASSSRALSSSI